MRKIGSLVLVMFLFASAVVGQTEVEEREAIAATVQLYFDGMVQRDRSKLDQAFDANARLIGFRGENFTVTPYEQWASGTAQGTPRNPADFDNRLINIEFKGYMALATTELFWPGVYYYDYLTLLKIDGHWKIVHKSWYEEKR
ncbi:nuclear transport factor 2 family protein [Mongoliitalea lutea]|uniref:Lumazine-binding n=1 Tax=Mongoliitalea lutea TaxID=849756 RepID=A0A8J3CYX9_9BACT|nr:nuclear transport factor 2 family protein [Mongoliitalea lutea]GHB42270.1 hypothetical protein GCM10008106_24110 [Mongoliitalea lutea]